MRRSLAAALLALTAAGLCGCGNKGALVLPPARPAAAASVSPPAAMAPMPAPASSAAAAVSSH